MARAQYIGVAGVARRTVNQHIGVDGVARTVKRGYIGVSGIARKFYPTPPEMEFSLVPGDSQVMYDDSYAGIYGDDILLKVVASFSYNTENRACANLDLDLVGAYAGEQLVIWYKWAVDINWCDALLYFFGADGQVIQQITLPDQSSYYGGEESYTIPAGTARIQIANTIGKAGGTWTITMTISSITIGGDKIF